MEGELGIDGEVQARKGWGGSVWKSMVGGGLWYEGQGR